MKRFKIAVIYDNRYVNYFRKYMLLGIHVAIPIHDPAFTFAEPAKRDH